METVWLYMYMYVHHEFLSILFCFKFNFIINWLAMHIYV